MEAKAITDWGMINSVAFLENIFKKCRFLLALAIG